MIIEMKHDRLTWFFDIVWHCYKMVQQMVVNGCKSQTSSNVRDLPSIVIVGLTLLKLTENNPNSQIIMCSKQLQIGIMDGSFNIWWDPWVRKHYTQWKAKTRKKYDFLVLSLQFHHFWSSHHGPSPFCWISHPWISHGFRCAAAIKMVIT